MSNQENLDMVYFSLIGLVYVGDLILGICYNVVFVEQEENMVTIKSCQNSKRYKGILSSTLQWWESLSSMYKYL